eukprot:EST45426.1 Serpin 1 [Spironucleus salmonicida]
MEPTKIAAINMAPALAQGQNIVFSPLSLIYVLALLSASAQGPAKDELNNVFNLQGYDPAANKNFHLAANIFMRNLNLLKSNDAMAAFKIDPQPLLSAEQVNKWVSDNTAGMIPKILEKIGDEEVILVSALYFSGKFQNAFDPRQTVAADFSSFNGKTPCQMMYAKRHMGYARTSTAQVVELEYADSDIVARLILPLEDGQAAFEHSLSEENLDAKLRSKEIELRLPQFEIQSTFELKQILQKVDVNQMFESIDCRESLGSQLRVSSVIQKSVITVDEFGTDAASVTIISMRGSSLVQEKVLEVSFNKPFWFILQDGQDLIFSAGIQTTK